MKLPLLATRDFIGRATMTLYFTVCATLKSAATIADIRNAEWTAPWFIEVVATVAALGFMMLIIATTVTRLPPVRTARGIEPRISALIGCFATVTLIAVPRAQAGSQLELVANLVTIIGFGLCIWCLWWLGRSFSIIAQARRLVTTGPYQIARHPLYACETIVLLGIILRNPAWSTVVVGAIVILFQYRRIINEERVLQAAFPEYDDYARRVPMLVPRVLTRQSQCLSRNSRPDRLSPPKTPTSASPPASAAPSPP